MITLIKNRYRVNGNYFLERLQPVVQKLDIRGDVTIKLGGEKESRELNRTHLGRDYPTDVLSFPMHLELPGGYYLGDVFICHPLARKQAGNHKHTLDRELLILMVHGLLHLAGYDHERDTGEMQALQNRIVKDIP